MALRWSRAGEYSKIAGFLCLAWGNPGLGWLMYGVFGVNDIKRAAAKRLDKKLRLSGYFLEPGQDSVPMSEVWLYSCNVKDKQVRQRASFQLTFNVYKDVLNKSEYLYTPLDEDEQYLLSDLYQRYDNDAKSVSAVDKQILSLLLLRISLSLKFNYDEEIVNGTHFVVLDVTQGQGPGFMVCGYAMTGLHYIAPNDELIQTTVDFLDGAKCLQ